MRSKINKVYACGIVFALMSATLAAQADVSYMTVSEGAGTYADTYTSMFTVVGDASTGTAGIESHAWSDGTYWYYSYQIFNNDGSGTPGNNNFGYTKCDPNVSGGEGIYSFSVTLTNAPGGVDNLDVTGSAASTGGGGAWGSIVDLNVFPEEFIEGASWAINQTGAAGDADKITPAQWEYSNKQGGTWTLLNGGDTSTDDSLQYFQFVSTWAPGVVQGSILASGTLSPGDVQAGGDVLGPAVIPEPATGVTFAFGALALLRGRRFIGFA
jgi:hypothetical protein